MMLKIITSIIKVFILKVKYGKRLHINNLKQAISYDTEIKVQKQGSCCLGGIRTQSNVHLVCVKGNLRIGNHVSFNRNCIVICRLKISIGDNCSFGPNVCIYDHDHIFNCNGFESNGFNCSDVIIEDGCWIGAGAIILRGTHIKKNSVIGAGTVVKGDIPANSMVTSNRENNIVQIK